MEKALSTLTKEPYCYRPWELRDLCAYQVKHLLFRKDNRPDDSPASTDVVPIDGTTPEAKMKQMFFELHRKVHKLTEQEILVKWQEHCKATGIQDSDAIGTGVSCGGLTLPFVPVTD